MEPNFSTSILFAKFSKVYKIQRKIKGTGIIQSVNRAVYGLDDWGSVPGRGSRRIFSPHRRIQTGSGATQPPIQWVLGELFSGVKRPEHEADHCPPSSVEVKNAWSYTSTLQYVNGVELN
jgi:hypothetical protein